MKDMKDIEFRGNRIKLPWKGWENIEISPEGIHTHKGTISPAELELLFWKASYYDRGNRNIAEEIMGRDK
jgi:hypothetical protein